MQKGCSLDGSWFEYESESQESPWRLLYLDKVKKQLEELKLVSPNELSPCNPDELIWLEQQLGISLPKAYVGFEVSDRSFDSR